MKYSLTERKVLRKLRIPDFKHMTKDKVVKFISMIPKMDPEVAKAAIAQFPEFKDLASDIVSNFKQTIDNILQKNGESQRFFYDTCNSIIDSLKKELEKDGIDSEERDRIENKMIQVAYMIGEKDSENKRFLAWIVTGAITLGGGIIVFATTQLGNNLSLSRHKDDEEDDDDEDDE